MGDDVQWGPRGRFKRIYWEFEIEVVDEMALRTHDLHALNDEDGNFQGLVDMDDNERVQWALTFIAQQAWQAATPSTGVKFVGGGVAMVRPVVPPDGHYYLPITLPGFPVRGDEGQELGDWPPPASEQD